MKNKFKIIKKRFARLYTAFTCAVITAIFSVIPSSAGTAGTAKFDTSSLLGGIKTGLIAVISITGAGLAVFGVIHLIEAQSSQDPNAKSSAIKQLAAGLGLIIVGAIVVPVFIDSIKFS